MSRLLTQHKSLQLLGAAQTTEAVAVLPFKIDSLELAVCSSISSSPVARALQTKALPAATGISAAGMSPVAPGNWAAAANSVSPSKQMLCSPTRQPLVSCNVPRLPPACHAKRSLVALHHQRLYSSSASPAALGACGSGGSVNSSSHVEKRHEHDGILSAAAPAGLAARHCAGPLTPAVTEPLMISHPNSMAHQQHWSAQQTTVECAAASSADTIAAVEQVPAPLDILESPPELEHVATSGLLQQPTDCPAHLQQQERHKPRMSGRRVTARYDIPLGLDWLSNMPDHMPQLGEGRLDLIMGPMFAGKTTALINRVQQVSAQQDRLAVAVKSAKDERYGNHWIVTHDGRCMRCYTTDTLAELRTMLGPAYAKFQVLAIDEAQFFPDLVEFCQEAVDVDGKHVIVAGLSGDFKRQRFGQMLELLPLADSVTQLKSQCAFCDEPALFSLRVVGVGGPQALVGGDDKYKATCRRCYLQHTTTMQ